jgi:hypothetical protein
MVTFEANARKLIRQITTPLFMALSQCPNEEYYVYIISDDSTFRRFEGGCKLLRNSFAAYI